MSLREHACVSSRGAQSTELVSLYIVYWTLNNYYYYYDSNTTCDEDSNTTCNEYLNTTCDEDCFSAGGATVKEDGGEEVDIILSRPGCRC